MQEARQKGQEYMSIYIYKGKEEYLDPFPLSIDIHTRYLWTR
jgi:hypothetical protein